MSLFIPLTLSSCFDLKFKSRQQLRRQPYCLTSPCVCCRGEPTLRLQLCGEQAQIRDSSSTVVYLTRLSDCIPLPSDCISPFSMLQRWCQTVLTFFQVIHLARALPRPHDYGQSPRSPSAPCFKSLPSSAFDATAEASTTALLTSITTHYSNVTNTTGLTLTSAVTLVDASLQLQVVTSTDLPPVQVPTSTSATQSSPDISGVSVAAGLILHL